MDQATTFLTIPRELRDKIYGMLLTTPHAFREQGYETDHESHYELHPAIIGVSRQTYSEARKILYGKNVWIVIIVDQEEWSWWCGEEGGMDLPVVSSRRGAGHLVLPALTVRLDLGGRKGESVRRLVMGRESLPDLQQVLLMICSIDPRSSRKPAARLHFGSSASLPEKAEVFEPLLRMRGFGNVKIDGDIEEASSKRLKKRMTSTWDSVDEVLDVAFGCVKKGDELDKAGKTRAASLCFERGIQFVRFAGFPARDTWRDVTQHSLADLRLTRLSQLLKVRWVKTLLKLGHYADVVLLARELHVKGQSVQHIAGQITLTEYASLCLYEVLALLGLGEEDRCREALSDWMRAMTDITSWETMREEFNAGRAGKTNLVFKFHTIVLDRMRMGVSVEYPPDVEERRSREVDVRSGSMAYGYLDAILEYCLGGTNGQMRSMNVQGCLLDREELSFPVGEDWSRTATKVENHQRLMARCDQKYYRGI